MRLYWAALNWFLVPASSRGTAEVVIAAFDGGLVVLDPTQGTVRRRYGTGPVSEQYIGWREAFTRYVTAPAFTVSRDREVVTEEFVQGDHLLDVDVATRMKALRELLFQFAELTRAEGRSPDGPVGELLRDAVTHASLPRDYRDLYDRSTVDWLDPMAWVPSAFEATAKNLVVSTDGLPIPIDLGDLCPSPSFLYPVGMISAAGPQLVERYLHGELDDAVKALLSASGQTYRPEPADRVGLLLVRLAYAAFRDCSSPDGLDREAFAQSVERRWAELGPMLEPSLTQ